MKQTINSINATATIKTTETQQYEKNLMSVGSKIWKLVKEKLHMPVLLHQIFRRCMKYNEPVQLSIISTYLSKYLKEVKNR